MTLPLPTPAKRTVVLPRRTVLPKPTVADQRTADSEPRLPAVHPEYRLVDVPLDQLRPHPLQAVHFGGVDPANVARLKLSMAERGQKEPVDITEAYLVIDGRSRLEAAKQLVWPTIRCRVRDDLQDEKAIEQFLLRANFDRRQLSRLSMVYIAVTLNPPEDSNADGKTAYYEKIAAIVGLKSCKQVTRLLPLLKLPVPLHESYDRELTAKDCQRLIAMGPEVCDQLAKQKLAGEDWLNAAAELLADGPAKAGRKERRKQAAKPTDDVETLVIRLLALAVLIRPQLPPVTQELKFQLDRKGLIAAQKVIRRLCKEEGMPLLEDFDRAAERKRKASGM